MREGDLESSKSTARPPSCAANCDYVLTRRSWDHDRDRTLRARMCECVLLPELVRSPRSCHNLVADHCGEWQIDSRVAKIAQHYSTVPENSGDEQAALHALD